MRDSDFRFDPPAARLPAALGWVLRRAFGPAGAGPQCPVGRDSAALAERLGLAGRILDRTAEHVLAAESGVQALELLRGARRVTIARQLAQEAALAACDEAAGDLGIPYAPLKGQALVLGGWSSAAARPAGDVDLLVPRRALATLHAHLLRRGWRTAGSAYEHQAPMLRHAGGGQLELHRVVLGVRLAGRRSAGFEDLERSGLLAGTPPAPAALFSGPVHWPAPAVLAAHALVHALAQHALAPGAYSGLLLAGDLIDLGFGAPADADQLETIQRWVRSALSRRELGAAAELVAALAAGEPPVDADSDAQHLLAHFVLGATDSRYQAALKSRLLERPLSDRPRPVARLALLGRTLIGPRLLAGDSRMEPWGSWSVRLTRRPLELARKWRSSRRALRPPDEPGGDGNPQAPVE